MRKYRLLWMLLATGVGTGAALGVAAAEPALGGGEVFQKGSASVVAVQYTLESEAGRQELSGIGLVVGADGLVMVPVDLVPMSIPETQLKDFKVIIPRRDGASNDELDADFLGRDPRYHCAFVRLKEKRAMTPLKFEPVPVKVGERIYSIGILDKASGFQPFQSSTYISAIQRGPVHQISVAPRGLTNIGSVVFNERAQPIGWVHPRNPRELYSPFLPDEGDAGGMAGMLLLPPDFFLPISEFAGAIAAPPTAGKPVSIPWTGLQELSGLTKDVAEFNGMGAAALVVEVVDVVPGSPADAAGLKRGQFITQINGQPLDRGDNPDELPSIFLHTIERLPAGSDAVLTVIPKKGEAAKQVMVKLGEEPKQAWQAARFFAEDMGFSVRDSVFDDIYPRKLPADTKGVVISFLKEQSAAEAAELKDDDLILELNSKPVASADGFKQAYQAFRKEKPQEAIVLVVMRGGSTQVIRVEPPR